MVFVARTATLETPQLRSSVEIGSILGHWWAVGHHWAFQDVRVGQCEKVYWLVYHSIPLLYLWLLHQCFGYPQSLRAGFQEQMNLLVEVDT